MKKDYKIAQEELKERMKKQIAKSPPSFEEVKKAFDAMNKWQYENAGPVYSNLREGKHNEDKLQ